MTLDVGDRVAVFGGQYGVAWLGGRPPLVGTVLKWNPGPRKQPVCVVHLDEEFTTTVTTTDDGAPASGNYLVLHLRGRRDKWRETGTVQVELFDREPESAPAWDQRPQGVWVETHATYADVSAGDGTPLPPNEVPFYVRLNRP